MTDCSNPAGPLAGVLVLDLSRILAGPTCTQLLGDLGATVIKIENPKTGGDDTRRWGPPYAETPDGKSDLSAYFLSSNRNKYSVAADLSTEDGRALVKRIAGEADILIENYKVGGLAKYGLDAETLCVAHPGLVYCSISGFGQTGPNRDKPGYDLMAQGFGGIMSLTGAAEGPPMKVGVGIADLMCGMYAAVGILAALLHRDATGEGQHIDLALVDTQMSWLINEGLNYLTSGALPERRGNAHPNIVPYEVFETSDGHIIVAVGNDAQYQRFCAVIERPDLGDDSRFSTNPDRIAHRDALIAEIAVSLREMPSAQVLQKLETVGVPCGPINTLDQALRSDQAKARELVKRVDHAQTAEGSVELLGNPLKFSRTPVSFRRPPPRFGQDTAKLDDILSEVRNTHQNSVRSRKG